MKKISTAALFICLVLAHPISSRSAFKEPKPSKSGRESLLLGPVKSIRYEWCMLSKTPNEEGEYSELEHTLVKTLTFDTSGKLILQDPPPYLCGASLWVEAERHIRKYDENGNEVEDIVTDLEGRLLRTIVQAFDPAGNRTEVAYYHPDSTLDFK